MQGKKSKCSETIQTRKASVHTHKVYVYYVYNIGGTRGGFVYIYNWLVCLYTIIIIYIVYICTHTLHTVTIPYMYITRVHSCLCFNAKFRANIFQPNCRYVCIIQYTYTFQLYTWCFIVHQAHYVFQISSYSDFLLNISKLDARS